MSDAAYNVLCESAFCRGKGVTYEVSYAAPGTDGVTTFVLVCPACGGTTAVQDAPDAPIQQGAVSAASGSLAETDFLPKSIPVEGAWELPVTREDPTRPDGKAEAEFHEASEKIVGRAE